MHATGEPWGDGYSRPTPRIHVLLRVSSTCRAARHALRLVQEIRLASASECDTRILAHLVSVCYVEVCCIHNATLAETMALNSGIEEKDLQGLRTQVADTEMTRRLPFALCALPRCAYIEVMGFEGYEDSLEQITFVFKEFMHALCDARAAGQLRALRLVHHGCLDCEDLAFRATSSRRVAGNWLPLAADVLKARGGRCMCDKLLRHMPPHNILLYLELHDLCADPAERVRALLRSVEVNEPVPKAPDGVWCPSSGCGNLLESKPGSIDFVPLFRSDSLRPTYFDCCFASCVNSEDYDTGIAVLISAGGRPGPALREAAQSGRMKRLIIENGNPDHYLERANKVVEWVLQPTITEPQWLTSKIW